VAADPPATTTTTTTTTGNASATTATSFAGAPDVELLGPVSAIPAKQRTNVFVEVVNLGPSGMHGTSILVQPASGGLIVVGQVQRSLRDLAANNSSALVVRVATPEAAGSASLSLTFTFADDAGVIRTVTRTLNVQIAPPVSAPLDITMADAALVAGEPGNISLEVANPTASNVTNLDLTLVPPSQQVLGGLGGATSTQAITPGNGSALLLHRAQLGPRQSAAVEASVIASLRPEDLVPFAVQATYTVDGFQRDQTFSFGVRVVGSVKIRVLDARLERAEGGLVLTGTVVNSGTGTAWNPRVEAAEGSGLRSDRPDLIADLKPNQATDFRVVVRQVGQAAAGAPLVAIGWNDDFGGLHTTRVAGTGPVAAPPEPANLFSRLLGALRGPWGLLALAVVVVLVGIDLVLRLGRAHREREEEAELDADESDPSRKRPRGGRKPRPSG
jgi:hypothetical protein